MTSKKKIGAKKKKSTWKASSLVPTLACYPLELGSSTKRPASFPFMYAYLKIVLGGTGEAMYVLNGGYDD